MLCDLGHFKLHKPMEDLPIECSLNSGSNLSEHIHFLSGKISNGMMSNQ